MKPSTCQGATNRGKQTSVKFEQWRTPSVQALRGQCFSGKTLVSFMFGHRRFQDTGPASLAITTASESGKRNKTGQHLREPVQALLVTSSSAGTSTSTRARHTHTHTHDVPRTHKTQDNVNALMVESISKTPPAGAILSKTCSDSKCALYIAQGLRILQLSPTT